MSSIGFRFLTRCLVQPECIFPLARDNQTVNPKKRRRKKNWEKEEEAEAEGETIKLKVATEKKTVHHNAFSLFFSIYRLPICPVTNVPLKMNAHTPRTAVSERRKKKKHRQHIHTQSTHTIQSNKHQKYQTFF